MNLLYKVAIFVLLVITLPLQILLATLIFILCGAPVFFTQRRVGKNNKEFVMYKFRTMRTDAENLQKQFRKLNISNGPVFKIPHDPRFTPFGKFLSHTGLDELPQLWNVLRGEMALMGPRPLPTLEAMQLKPWMKKRHRILPGIISPAILAGKYHEDFEGWMRSDVQYAEQKNTITDALLAFRSVSFLSRLLLLELGRRST